MIVKKDYKSQADERLMELSSSGDAKAFECLYDRYSKKMINFFYRMLWKDREKAEDFMQDLFTKIISRPDLYDGERKFSSWLYSIANNMCKNEYRKHEVRKKAHPEIAYESMTESNPIPIDNMDKKTFKNALEEELQALNHEQRVTFIMRYKHHMSIKEIADTLECSEGTVKSRIFYTLKKLADKLQIYDPANILNYGKS